MSKYLITSDKFKGSLLFEYEKGILNKLEFSKDFSEKEELRIWLLSKTRIKEEEVEAWQSYKDIDFTRLLNDTTFEAFYKLYPRKDGKKLMAMRTWEKMSEADRIKAISHIDTLITQKSADGTAFPYASTYLNQKYWL